MRERHLTLALVLLGLSCGAADERHSEAAPTAAAESAGAGAASAEKMRHARQQFQRVKDTLLKNYYNDKITEDDLYQAALKGMLTYVDPGMEAWNKLLTPEEFSQMKLELSGEITGIGVQIKFDGDSGITDVLGTIPGSAADKAGVREGDKILSVNGKSYRGKKLPDVVAEIRGKVGETVTLSLLRGDQVLRVSIARARVRYDNVSKMLLPGRLGYLQIGGFNANTVKAAREVLEELKQKGVAGLVVDLRGNQGGAFDQAVAAAELFLDKGQPIVKLRRRGGKEESFVAGGAPVLPGVPMVILVNGATASGAEFLTAALRDGRRAQVLGDKTFGKWSVQVIEDLEDHFAIKYTSAQFLTPAGQSYEGKGLQPDIQVNVDKDDKQLARAEHEKDPEKRLQLDVQLRTAAHLLGR